MPSHHYAFAFLLGAIFCAGCTKPSASPVRDTPQPARKAVTTPAPTLLPHTEPAAEMPQARPTGPITFTEVTAPAGIHFHHNNGAFGSKYLPETMGSGVCVIDYDGDGLQDIFFVNSSDWPGHVRTHTTSALYRNNGDGTFTDVTRASGLGVEFYGMGCTVGDYDNDGHDDLYVTGVGGNHLFRNMGNGKFSDVTAHAGVKDGGFSTGAVWFDYDNDGKLDLFVSHYVEWTAATDQSCSLNGKGKSYCTPEAYKGQSATLFHNKGNGVFEDVTKKAGLYDPSSKSLGVALLDFDDDGWLDLFVANDTQPNKLYRNNHNGTFTESALATGVAFSDAGKARAGMGADAADFDGTGRQGLVIGNFTNESLALYRNDGGGLFTDATPASGIGPPSAKSLTFATFFFDYDLDGRPDIFAFNGHVADDINLVQPTIGYAEPTLLFHNRGGGRFDNVSERVGDALRKAVVGRGAAFFDYDNDGDLDLVLNTSNGPARLLRNNGGNANDMLRVKLVGTRANRDAIGARVTVRLASGSHETQMVKSGSSYLSQCEFPLTFGLGKPAPDKVVSLEIVWPGGRHEKIASTAANQFITVQEGKGITLSKAIAFTAGVPPLK